MIVSASVAGRPTSPARYTNDASCTPKPPRETGRRAEASATGTVAISRYSGTEDPSPTAMTYVITAAIRLSPTDST